MKIRRPSPALVISCIALFVALSGTGYAVSKLPRNSVGSAQIKKNSVTSVKVKDRSLVAADFKRGQLPAGAKGDKGDRGPAASAGAELNRNPEFSLPGGGVPTLMFSLTQFNDRSTGRLVVSEPSRLVVNSTVQLRRLTSDPIATICRIWLNAGGVDWEQIGNTTNLYETSASNNERLHGPGTTFVDVAPGSYDLRMTCETGDDNEIAFISGSITAVATAR